jgi:ABC-type multidrug transport system fused ATPase/permease subunit
MATSALLKTPPQTELLGPFTTLRRFLPYLRPYTLHFTLVLAMLIVTTIASLGQMYLIMVGLDYIVNIRHDMPGMDMSGMAGMAGMSDIYAAQIQQVGLIALAFIALQLLISATKIVNNIVMSQVSERLSVTMRQDVLRRLHKVSLYAHRQQAGGAWISRVLFDVDRLRSLLSGALLKTVYSLLFLIVASVFLLAINPRITLPVIIFIPVMAAIAYRWSRRLQPGYDVQRKAWDRVVGFVSERLEGRLDIRAFGREAEELGAFEQITDHYRDLHTRTSLQRAALSAYLEVAAYIVTCLLIWFGGLQFISSQANQTPNSVFIGARALMPMAWMLLGVDKMMASMGMAQGAALSAGALSAFVLFAGRMVSPIRGLSHQYGELAQIHVSATRVLDILDQPEEREGGAELPPVAGRITFEHVSFGYQRDLPVLRDVSLTIAPGQHVVIVGPTGAGKTTLVNLMSGYCEPTQGRILIDDHDLRTISLRSLRRQLVAVPQETELFDGTVMENIRFGKPDATNGEVVDAAQSIGVHELLSKLSRGYQTPIGEGGTRLSSGQRQLVALARAALAAPRVLVLDEAVSSVDQKTQTVIMNALRHLLEGRSALLVAHDLTLAWQGDYVVVIDGGRIVEMGPPHDLLARGGRFAELWHIRQEGLQRNGEPLAVEQCVSLAPSGA